MPMTPAQWVRTTGLTEYEVVMHEEAAKRTWEYSGVYGDKKKNGPGDQEIKGYIWGAFGYPYERDYGEDIQTEQMHEIGEWSLTDVEVALGFDLDEKLLEDMRHISEKEFLNRAGEGVGYAFSQAKCVYAAKPFNQAFVTTGGQEMYDEKALCASDHPLQRSPNPTTVDNSLPAGSPSFSNIWDMCDWHRTDQYTHEGLRKPSTGMTFLCHDVQKRYVDRILTQQYEFDGTIATGGTTDYVSSKNVNNLKGKGINVVYCLELIDTAASFMFGRRAKRNFRFRMRKNLTTHWEYGRRNRTRSAFSHMRLMVGVTDYDDFVGRPGS